MDIAGFVFIMTTGAGNIGNGALFEIKAIASNVIGGILLNGGVGNLFGAPIGTLTLLIINELIRVAGVQSNFQAMVSGLLLYLFIVLQSIVMSLRGRKKFRLALPLWLKPHRLQGKKKAENQGQLKGHWGADHHGRGGAKGPPEPQVLIAPGAVIDGNLMTGGCFTLLGSVTGAFVCKPKRFKCIIGVLPDSSPCQTPPKKNAYNKRCSEENDISYYSSPFIFLISILQLLITNASSISIFYID